jgi:hypothetical protein
MKLAKRYVSWRPPEEGNEMAKLKRKPKFDGKTKMYLRNVKKHLAVDSLPRNPDQLDLYETAARLYKHLENAYVFLMAAGLVDGRSKRVRELYAATRKQLGEAMNIEFGEKP